MLRLRALWDSIRSTYWAVPSVMAVAAAVLAFGAVGLDRTLGDQVAVGSWMYSGSADGARTLLSTIAASMITVAGTAFSITIVVLTLASQQFGPRLLRGFLGDLGNQVVLGTFVSTFIYCLLVLRAVRGEETAAFVPHAAVTGGVALAVLSLGVLIYFIHHVSTSIQASRIIAAVSSDLDATMVRLFPAKIGEGAAMDAPATLPEFDGGTPITAAAAGYVQAVDGDVIVGAAASQDVVLRLEARPGSFVRRGSTLARVCRSRTIDEATAARVRGAFIIGVERTPTQDIGFHIGQLVEVAVRALSPGVNDPATACACLDRLGQALSQFAQRDLPSPWRLDDRGALRAIATPVTFADACAMAFHEIRRYGQTSVSVTARALEVIAEIAPCATRAEDRQALTEHAGLIAAGSRTAPFIDADRAVIDARYRDATAALQS
jgi:uncharacterized membrane protein